MSSSFLKFCHSFDKLVTRLRVAFYVTNSMCYHTRDIQTYRSTTNLSIKAQEVLNTGVQSIKQSALVNGGIVAEEW